jgi:ATP-dependent helicase HrpA
LRSTGSSPVPPTAREALTAQLAWLIFPGFVTSVAWETLASYPRYLEAMRIRLDRARQNPAGDARKQAEFAPHWQRYEAFVDLEQKPVHNRTALREYRWLTEEFRISLFAQELRTAIPASSKRLDALWQTVLRG